MKTAEEILNNQRFGFSKYQEESALKAMKEYAEQEVKKHLEIAADKAKINMPSHPHFHGTNNIIRESITNIKIELT